MDNLNVLFQLNYKSRKLSFSTSALVFLNCIQFAELTFTFTMLRMYVLVQVEIEDLQSIKNQF